MSKVHHVRQRHGVLRRTCGHDEDGAQADGSEQNSLQGHTCSQIALRGSRLLLSARATGASESPKWKIEENCRILPAESRLANRFSTFNLYRTAKCHDSCEMSRPRGLRPCFFIRLRRVLGFMPKSLAAPLGPFTTPDVCFKTCSIWRRSISSRLRVLSFPAAVTAKVISSGKSIVEP